MGKELSVEEQEAADKLKAESTEEKTKIDQISDDLAGVTDMLKSHVEKKEDPPAGDEKPSEIDYSAIVVEDLAKSLVESDDREKTVEFISRLAEGCNLLPHDMIDKNGNPFIDTEMMKSLEDSADEGKQYLKGILYAMQESNERTEKVNAVNMQLMSALTKSIQDQTGIMAEMEKSFAPKTIEKKVDAVTELPEFKENTETPLSQDTGGDSAALVIDRDVAMRAIKKSFRAEDGDEVYIKQTTYCGLVAQVGFEAAISQIPLDDAEMIQSNLPA